MSTTKEQPRGYWTPCDKSEPIYVRGKRQGCDNVTKLSKPGRWRCPECVQIHGELKVTK
jgi:hypothetical protein